MKKIILFFILSLFLNADYLNTRDNNHCIIELEPNQDDKGWCYHDQNQDSDECDRRLEIDDLISGYEYKDDECVLKNDLEVTGLTQEQWNSYMAFLAHALGFTMLFLIDFLAVLVARR
jgi:hypothetical protein